MSTDPKHLELARLTLPGAILHTAVAAQIDVQAAQIAFNAVFAMGPLMALTTTLLSALPTHALQDRFREVFLPYAPEAVRPLLESQIRGLARAPNVVLLVASLLGLLWTISATSSAISTALGNVGWVPLRGWAKQRLRGAMIGGLAAIGLALSAVAASVGPVLLELLARLTRLPLVGLASLAWLRWPVSGVVFGVASALFIAFGTAQRPRRLATFWGGLVSGIICVMSSSLLGLFLAHAPSMGGAYGAAGAVFAALLWLYLLSFGLLAGSIVAYVLDVRGPHLLPMLSGAPHVQTHVQGHAHGHKHGAAGRASVDQARDRGRILRRQHLGSAAPKTRSRIARRVIAAGESDRRNSHVPSVTGSTAQARQSHVPADDGATEHPRPAQEH